MKWPLVPLPKVAIINPRRPKDIKLRDNDPVTFVPMTAISEVTASIEMAEIRPYSEVKKGYTYFEENDILFAKITPCMENGKSAIATGLWNGVGFGSTEFHVLRAKDNLLIPKFLHYFIRQPSFRDAAKSRMRGAAGQQRVPKDFLDEVVLPLPPLSEQRRIVEILDQADALRKKRAEADTKAARILFALFIKSFGNPLTNPMGWQEVALGSCCDIVTGNTPNTKKAEYYGKDILWARPADLDNQILVTKTEKMLSAEGGKVARIVPPNSVLVVCIGATLGKVALAGAEMAINQQINAALPSDSLLPEFLYVQCALLADRFRAAATKSTLPILNKSRFSNQKVLCPPKEKQKAFVRAARTVISSHDARAASREQLEALFQSLLHLAFTGNLTARWREAHMEELLEEMEQQAKYLNEQGANK